MARQPDDPLYIDPLHIDIFCGLGHLVGPQCFCATSGAIERPCVIAPPAAGCSKRKLRLMLMCGDEYQPSHARYGVPDLAVKVAGARRP